MVVKYGVIEVPCIRRRKLSTGGNDVIKHAPGIYVIQVRLAFHLLHLPLKCILVICSKMLYSQRIFILTRRAEGVFYLKLSQYSQDQISFNQCWPLTLMTL